MPYFKRRQMKRRRSATVESVQLSIIYSLLLLWHIPPSLSFTVHSNSVLTVFRPIATESRPSTHLNQSFYVAPNEDDDDLIRTILGPAGNKKRRPQGRTITILSDTTGVTAKCAVEKSLKQFNGCDERVGSSEDSNGEDPCELMQKRVHPFIKDPAQLEPLLEEAKERDSMIVFTFGDPKMRAKATEICQANNLQYVDLLGPMLDAMVGFFGRQPLGTVELDNKGSRRELTDLYFDQMEAIEFTLEADDGRAPSRLSEADVIILGVSRTGKSPLSVFLSQSLGLKVANIPLNMGTPLPEQLFGYSIDPNRVFCLTLDPDDLQRIREARLERESDSSRSQERPSADYADWDRLDKELDYARDLADEHGFTEIDVTGRAVEETASLISSLLNQRMSSFE